MRMNKKMLAATAILAVGILTGCGASGSGSTASSAVSSAPASSAVPASSRAAEEGAIEPINMLTWTLDDLDKTDTVTFISAGIVSGVQNGSLTANVFS